MNLVQAIGLTCCCLCGSFLPDWPIRTESTAVEEGAIWSRPEEGVRARLLSEKRRYRVGEPLVVTLEIQNVSRADLAFEEPQVMPMISYPGNHPYGKHSYPWVLTCETPGSSACIRWGAREVYLRAAASRLRLKPGETWRVQVVAISPRKEFGPDRPSKRGEPSRQEAHFVGADEPGVYLLKATFARPDADGVEKAADKGAWSGKRLETPAIRVEIVK